MDEADRKIAEVVHKLATYSSSVKIHYHPTSGY